MKIAIISDTHCGIRNSSEIFIKYQEQFYSQVFFPYLKENGIKKILHLGDYYDNRKMINFKALHANRRMFLDVLVREHIHMDIVPGNHDVFYKSTNELCSLKELLGYYTANVNIEMKPKVMNYDGCKIALVPWINADNYSKTMSFVKRCKADICAGHFEFAGFEMIKGMTTSHGGMDTKAFNKFEMVLSGHYHTKSTKGNVTYLGSQMQFNWSDHGDPKYFHVFDTETRELTAVPNPLVIYEKIIYNDQVNDYSDYSFSNLDEKFVKVIVDKKTDPYQFDRFIESIQNNASTYELKIAESFSEFVGENVDDGSISVEDTPSLINSYVDTIETDLDKDRIKGLMNTLYVEASNRDIA